MAPTFAMTHRRAIVVSLLALAVVPLAAQDRTIELLRQLADAPGPPGFEEPIRKVMVDQMKPYASAITFDGMGSIIATQGTQGPRIMVDAHMDELGGVVRRVTPRGLLTMQMLGGWLDQALVDQRWIIVGSKGPVRAVTGIRDVHVVPPEERTRVYSRDSLFLDVGAKDEAEVAAMGIGPGDPVVPDAPFTVLNGTQNYLAKAWDDRIGCAVSPLDGIAGVDGGGRRLIVKTEGIGRDVVTFLKGGVAIKCIELNTRVGVAERGIRGILYRHRMAHGCAAAKAVKDCQVHGVSAGSADTHRVQECVGGAYQGAGSAVAEIPAIAETITGGEVGELNGGIAAIAIGVP